MRSAQTGPRRTARIPIETYLDVQKREVLSPLNSWGAGEEVGHPPDPNEMLWHYLHIGRVYVFAAIHGDDHIYYTGLVIDCDPLDLPLDLMEAALQAHWEFWQDLFAKYPEQCQNVLEGPCP